MSPARYAQHFLTDTDAIARIVSSAAIKPDEAVLEIGPGRGALTSLLVQQAGSVVAVEVDLVMVDRLNRDLKDAPNFTVVHQDILKFDLASLKQFQTRDQPFKIIGNLPYNLTSPILRKLSNWSGWEIANVMVQKEVGNRLCARVGTGDYGALTAGMNLTCTMEPCFDLSPESFRPRPKVWSMVVKINRRQTPLTDDIDSAQRIIQAAFQQRRKTILNSLSHGLSLGKEAVREGLKALSIAEMARAETLTPQQFVSLSKTLL